MKDTEIAIKKENGPPYRMVDGTLRWSPVEYPIQPAHHVDFFIDRLIEGKIKFQDGTDIPIRIIHQFNNLVYHLEPNSLHHTYLPQQFIFKMPNLERNPDEHHELQIYQRLQSLQGHCLPRCYGEASWVDDSSDANQGIILEFSEVSTLWSL